MRKTAKRYTVDSHWSCFANEKMLSTPSPGLLTLNVRETMTLIIRDSYFRICQLSAATMETISGSATGPLSVDMERVIEILH